MPNPSIIYPRDTQQRSQLKHDIESHQKDRAARRDKIRSRYHLVRTTQIPKTAEERKACRENISSLPLLYRVNLLLRHAMSVDVELCNLSKKQQVNGQIVLVDAICNGVIATREFLGGNWTQGNKILYIAVNHTHRTDIEQYSYKTEHDLIGPYLRHALWMIAKCVIESGATSEDAAKNINAMQCNASRFICRFILNKIAGIDESGRDIEESKAIAKGAKPTKFASPELRKRCKEVSQELYKISKDQETWKELSQYYEDSISIAGRAELEKIGIDVKELQDDAKNPVNIESLLKRNDLWANCVTQGSICNEYVMGFGKEAQRQATSSTESQSASSDIPKTLQGTWAKKVCESKEFKNHNDFCARKI